MSLFYRKINWQRVANQQWETSEKRPPTFLWQDLLFVGLDHCLIFYGEIPSHLSSSLLPHHVWIQEGSENYCLGLDRLFGGCCAIRRIHQVSLAMHFSCFNETFHLSTIAESITSTDLLDQATTWMNQLFVLFWTTTFIPRYIDYRHLRKCLFQLSTYQDLGNSFVFNFLANLHSRSSKIEEDGLHRNWT